MKKLAILSLGGLPFLICLSPYKAAEVSVRVYDELIYLNGEEQC